MNGMSSQPLAAPLSPVVQVDMASATLNKTSTKSKMSSRKSSSNDLNSSNTSDRTSTNHQQVSLVWRDLIVGVKSVNKVLLNKVQGNINNGLYAIMGPSGSGKSTLLNALARRLDRNMTMSGEIKLNGRDYSHHELKWMSGYVMQDDMLNGALTVFETLRYTAELRLPPTISTEERLQRINNVIDQMGLNLCRDVVIGTPLKKGISGGERKRVCVAMELLLQPILLFLDEPTSGLDSVTALSLCTKLKQLAASGSCTVVCTIHQPQSKIFKLFDTLLLLKAGNIIYSGPAAEAATFFAQAGYPVPQRENPANHFMDVITPGLHESTQDLQEKEHRLRDTFQVVPVNLQEGEERPQFLQREVTPWIRQFAVLFNRTMQEQWRQWDIIAAQVLQSVVMAVLIGTAFLQIGTSQTSVSLRRAAVFFCCVNQGMFGSMQVINSFPSERLLVLRERAAGTYYVSAYFAAKCVAESIWQLPTPIIFSCIVYWLIGFQAVASKFFIFMAFMVLTSVASCSLALAVSALARTTDMSVTVLPLTLEVSRLFGAFYLAPAIAPGYFIWLQSISYLTYAYTGVALNELHGLRTYCDCKAKPPQGTCVNGVAVTCPVTSGQQQIDLYGLDKYWIGEDIAILITYIVVCRVIAYLGIRYIKW